MAVDRTSKFIFAQLHKAANVKSAVGFLQALIEAVPYTIHIVLTTTAYSSAICPHGVPAHDRYQLHIPTASAASMASNRLTKPTHPWTNRQVKRMNRTLKEATVRRWHYKPTSGSKSTSKPSSTPTTR